MKKPYLLGLFSLFVVSFLSLIPLLGRSPASSILATTDGWSTCVSNGPQCNANLGTQSRLICDVDATIHGTVRDVSNFYNKPTGDGKHCHVIQWTNLSNAQKNTFKSWHDWDDDYGSPNHGNWTSAYNWHLVENPLATEETRSCVAGEDRIDGCEADVCTNIDDTQTELPEGYYFSDEGVCSVIVMGCMDEVANNYDEDATHDDESCTYDEQPYCYEDETIYVSDNEQAPEGAEEGACVVNPDPDPDPTPTPTPAIGGPSDDDDDDNDPKPWKTRLSTDNHQCTEKEFDAIMDVREDGVGKGGVKVTFYFNGQTVEVRSNADGRARTKFARAAGDLKADAEGYPSQSQVVEALDCEDIVTDPDRGGQVLGATTLADTGATNWLALVMIYAGLATMGGAAYAYRKTNN